jgi:hypothetical protein
MGYAQGISALTNYWPQMHTDLHGFHACCIRVDPCRSVADSLLRNDRRLFQPGVVSSPAIFDRMNMIDRMPGGL